MTHIIVFGTSEPQDFKLLDKGVAINGANLTVAIEISAYADGEVSTVDSPPSVAWLSEADGTVRVSDVDNLAVGTYLVRFKLTDTSGNVGYCPTGGKADVWRVVAVANR